jgi:hypothetical protein
VLAKSEHECLDARIEKTGSRTGLNESLRTPDQRRRVRTAYPLAAPNAWTVMHHIAHMMSEAGWYELKGIDISFVIAWPPTALTNTFFSDINSEDPPMVRRNQH